MKDDIIAALRMVTPESFARALLGLEDDDDLAPYGGWLAAHFDAKMDKACRFAAKLVPAPKFDGNAGRKSEVARDYLHALVERRNKFARTIRDTLPLPWVARYQWTATAHG
jgi:hypothetical protein